MMILMLGSVFIVPSAVTPSSQNSVAMDIFNTEENVSPTADALLEELKYNVNQNPSFETADGDGWPVGYSGFATNYRTTDFAYTADTNSGTYAGYIASHGVSHGGTANAYLSRSIGQIPSAFMSGGLTLDFYWNTLNNPDLDVAAYTYLLVQTTNATGNYHEIRYFLSNNLYSVSNTTSMTAYLWNFTIGNWNHFSRDLSTDYSANPLNSPIDSTRRVTDFWWYAAAPSTCKNTIDFLLDDVTLTNGTYSSWLPNGGFETGDGLYWSYSDGTPTFVSQSTDSTDGVYSLNMTTGIVNVATGYGAVERDFNYPAGQYCYEPGLTVIEFDWQFSRAIGSAYQYSTLDVTFANETSTYYLHFFLGFGADTIIGFANSSNHIYIALEGFNDRDTWHNVQLDMYDYISEFGSTVGTITEFQFYVHATNAGSQVTLLVDDFLIMTSPTGDPGFELDWYESSNTPFAGWFRASGDINSIKRTTDSFTGTYACNLTPRNTASNLAAVTRSTFVDVSPDDYLDLWWRLDAMNDVSSSYAYASLTFESGKMLFYLLGSSSGYSPSNTTTVGFINVNGFNTTGVWTNLHRNITRDAEEVFALSEDWQISSVAAYARYDHSVIYESRVSLIVDDFIITDGRPPVITAVDQLPAAPMYYDDVHVQIGVTDARPGVDHVLVNYTTNGGSNWHSVPTTGGYDAYIPVQDYGTTVEYFVVAVDGVGLQGINDNGGLYYSYTVGDDVDPTLSIDTPAHLSNVEGVVAISTTVEDLGSGVDYVQFIIDSGTPVNDDTSPYSYNWDTNVEDLGLHTIDVIVHDNAGNTQTDTIDVTVVDTMHPIVDEPPDFEFVEGLINQIITWQVSDLRPDSFEVLVNGSQIHSGPWTLSSTTIEITVDTIGRGVHNVTLIVVDAGGNSASDTVIVTVTPHYFTETETPTTTTSDTTPPDTTTSSGTGSGDSTPLVIIAVVGVGGILLVVFVVLPVLKKR